MRFPTVGPGHEPDGHGSPYRDAAATAALTDRGEATRNAAGFGAALGALGGEASLSVLLGVQALTLFVALPLGAAHPAGRVLLDAGHVAFAAVSAVALTRRPAVRAAVLGALALLLVLAPGVGGPAPAARLGLGPERAREVIAAVALVFNALVTALVAGRVFGPGRVTTHRVQGAVLVYLNVAALFALLYGLLDAHAPGAVAPAGGGALPAAPGARTAALSYFSLATLTTTGYGDLAPVHPLARSLATLEAVVGQLFPATLLARLVALHLAHGGDATPPPARRPG